MLFQLMQDTLLGRTLQIVRATDWTGLWVISSVVVIVLSMVSATLAIGLGNYLFLLGGLILFTTVVMFAVSWVLALADWYDERSAALLKEKKHGSK